MSNSKESFQKHATQTRWGTLVSSALPISVLAGIGIIVAAVFIAYLPSISGGFVFDDDHLLTENEIIKDSDGLYRFWCTTYAEDYWPVTYSTLWIEWRLWGMNATGYHVTNLILHVAEALLIWAILRKLSIPGAFLAAVIFAVHPVNVESVAWIAQRKNTMAMLFFLLSILWYLKADVQRSLYTLCADSARGVCGVRYGRWYWLSLAAFILAMLSKGSVAIFPVLLLMIIWRLRPLTKWDLVRTAPFFLVAVVLAGVDVWFQTHGTGVVIRTASFMERLLGAGGVIWFYLYKALWPINLVFIYPQWNVQVGNPLWWLPLLAALVVTTVLWWFRDRWSRALLFVWGFFCVALVPSMGFTDVGYMQYSLVADRYQHIAIIGVIALASSLWSAWHERARGVSQLGAIAAVMALVFLTWRQSGLYRDEITLYEATLKKNPDCWMVHNNLGIALVKIRRFHDAIEHYRQALLLKPKYPEALNNMGIALFKTGRMQEAAEHYRRALALKPNYPDALYNIGNILIRTGRPQESIEYFRQTLRLKPNYPSAFNNLGIALINIGRLDEAIKCFQQTLRLKSDFIEAYFNLALVHASRHEASEAIANSRKALELAKLQGNKAMAMQIEDWLNSYQVRATTNVSPSAEESGD